MLTHGNIIANLRGAWGLLERIGLGDEVFLSFLPLSHAYEHTAGQFLPIAMGAQIYYAEGADTLAANLIEARPTILTCVPRLYEVLRQTNRRGRRAAGRHQRATCSTWRSSSGGGAIAQGRLPLHLAAVDRLLDRWFAARCRQRFGGRLKAMVSGGAPLNPDVGLFFHALGLPVLQGYGQTEAAPVISANVPGRAKLDTVGPAAERGRGRGSPTTARSWSAAIWSCAATGRTRQATAQALRDGWLHTGDIGEIDADGYIRITDRKKDIIVNSGGDNVAPARVEGVLLLRARDRPGADLRRPAAASGGADRAAPGFRAHVRHVRTT